MAGGWVGRSSKVGGMHRPQLHGFTLPRPCPPQLPARLPAHSQGLAYGLSVAEAIVSPAMPSSTARAGGIFMPIISSLAHGGGSEPGEELLAGLGVGAKWLGIGQ